MAHTLKKQFLLQEMLRLLEIELEALIKSGKAAFEAATHTENQPENKYDTRSLEASYLAGAQKERSLELRAALQTLNEAKLRPFHENDPIALTALVGLDDGKQVSYCFIMTVGAGLRLITEGKEVICITPQSPLGVALMGKQLGDRCKIATSQGQKHYEIISLG